MNRRTFAPTTLLAALTLTLTTALVPTAAAAPGEAEVQLVRSEVMCSLILVDGVMYNSVGPAFGGSYPGRSAVQGLIGDVGPGGRIGGPVDSVAGALGAAWDTAYGAAYGALQQAERELARQGAELARTLNNGYAYVHEVKCWVTDGYVLPTWDRDVVPIGDCMFGDVNGGVEPPIPAWVFFLAQHPGTIAPPPACATFVPTYIPPITLPPTP